MESMHAKDETLIIDSILFSSLFQQVVIFMFTSFLFNYKACGGNFTSPQGSFDYLFYGTAQGYPNNQTCHWTITAPEPCQVCINHVSWNTEDSDQPVYIRTL